jgi:hypothetical protein
MPLLGKSDITSVERRSPQSKNDKQRSGSNVAVGIEWGPRKIYDIFEFVSQVTETGPIEVPEAEDNTDDESSEAALWFTPDPKLRWFSLLSSVAEGVLLQLIYIHYEFADSKGKKQHVSQQTTRNVLMHIPTNWEEGSPMFPLSRGTLQEWVKFMTESTHFVDDPEELQQETIDLLDTRIRDRSRQIKEDQPADIDAQYMDGSEEATNIHINNSVFNAQKKYTENTPVANIEKYTMDQFMCTLALIEPADGHMEFSEFDRRFARSNVYGKLLMMSALTQAEILRLSCLADDIADRTAHLERSLADLHKSAQDYCKWSEVNASRLSTWKNAREELTGKEVANSKRLAESSAFRAFHNSKPMPTGLASPYQSPRMSFGSEVRYFLLLICWLILSVRSRRSSGFMSFDPAFRTYAPGLKSFESMFQDSSPSDLVNPAVQGTSIPKSSTAPGTPATTPANCETAVEIDIEGIKAAGVLGNALRINFDGLDDILKSQAPLDEAEKVDTGIKNQKAHDDADVGNVKTGKDVPGDSAGKQIDGIVSANE